MEDQMSTHECPECGEEAVNQPTTDLVPWEAYGMERPQWSHRDGSSLCPVIGPSGGYEPAQPRERAAERDDPGVARLDPPATMRHEWPTTRTEATLDQIRAAGGADPSLMGTERDFWESMTGVGLGPDERQVMNWAEHGAHADGLEPETGE
jgi:hypothetical protein